MLRTYQFSYECNVSCQLSCTSMEYCQKHLLRLWNSISTTSSLWSGQSTSKGGHQVSWEKVFLPKREKVLAQIKHIWNLYTKAGSLWIAWVCQSLKVNESISRWGLRLGREAEYWSRVYMCWWSLPKSLNDNCLSYKAYNL